VVFIQRAQLEMTDQGILIQPVEYAAHTPQAETPLTVEPAEKRAQGLRGLLSRWRKDGLGRRHV
jgi:hypothetical protein